MRYLTDKSTETLHPLVNLDAKLQKKKIHLYFDDHALKSQKRIFHYYMFFFLPFKIYLKLQNMENEI